VQQLWSGLHRDLLAPDEITTLPKSLRAELALRYRPALTSTALQKSEDKKTIKWLWALPDGSKIETVLMHYQRRSTVCVSSQAGCAMGCGFCATGQAGYERHLTVGEILEQVVQAGRRAAADESRVSNVVFMGMGEPMANYDAVLAATRRLINDFGTWPTKAFRFGWHCLFTPPTTSCEMSSCR